MREAVIGVLGGMGPEATVRIMELLIAATPAKRDQDHLRIIVDNNPKVPDRTAAILGTGEDPLSCLEGSARTLKDAGADFLIIPCNTAHYWLDRLQARVDIPILNMVTETVDAIEMHRPRLRRVGLLATTGTLKTGLYQAGLSGKGVDIVETNTSEQEEVMRVIYGIKAGSSEVGQDLLGVARGLCHRGAEALILGCTELSLIREMNEMRCPLFDPMAIVARSAVKTALSWGETTGRTSIGPLDSAL